MHDNPLIEPTATTTAAHVDYRRIAEAIRFLRRERLRQPALHDLAAHLGLSAAHTQCLFSRWAGISPKRFVQYLTVQAIKRRMRETGDLLGLLLDAGLSGAGRLHDLFVTMEALSPGEYRQAAVGLTIHHGIGATPFGDALIAFTGRGICRLVFLDGDADEALAALQQDLSAARLREDPAGSQALLDQVFARDPTVAARGLSLWVPGSNFQIQVWRALLRLPFGAVASYAQLAASIGRPRAARAVGTAIGSNPVAFLIPCHRVLRADGEIGEYRWGSPRKAALLGWEAARSTAG